MSSLLTNKDISENYRDIELWLFQSSITSALAYWITSQNPNKTLIDIGPALLGFKDESDILFPNPEVPVFFSYDELSHLISEDTFVRIPSILALNSLKPDFIDLGALARNVFYMVLRGHITN